MDNRTKLSRIIKGEKIDNSVHYDIEMSVNIKGEVTIWGGMDFLPSESVEVWDDLDKVVSWRLVPLYEYFGDNPYTARIFQIETDLALKMTDEFLIGEYKKFRKEHPDDGFGFRLLMCHLIDPDLPKGTDPYRKDKVELWNRRFEEERKDIFSLWGVDCPPDINLPGPNKSIPDRKTLKEEFVRIGGDWEHYNQKTRIAWIFPSFCSELNKRNSGVLPSL